MFSEQERKQVKKFKSTPNNFRRATGAKVLVDNRPTAALQRKQIQMMQKQSSQFPILNIEEGVTSMGVIQRAKADKKRKRDSPIKKNDMDERSGNESDESSSEEDKRSKKKAKNKTKNNTESGIEEEREDNSMATAPTVVTTTTAEAEKSKGLQYTQEMDLEESQSSNDGVSRGTERADEERVPEDNQYTSAKVPDWQEEYLENFYRPNWITTVEKVMDLLDQEFDNIYASEDTKLEKNEQEEISEREEGVKNVKEWIIEKRIELTRLTKKRVALDKTKGKKKEERDEISRLDAEIEELRKECEDKLNELYKSFNIPTTDARIGSPRKFADADGTIYYFGSIPEEIKKHLNGVRKEELNSQEELTQVAKCYPYTYTISYGEETNLLYVRNSEETKEPPTGVFRHRGKSEPLNVSSTHKEKYLQIAKKVDKLRRPVTPQRIVYTSNARRKERGKGAQYTAMNRTNAAAYAFGSGLTHQIDTNWEWLHIRGAGLGGATNSTNLIAGTYSANSHMIPYENQIKAMSAYASREHPLYVKWELEREPVMFSGKSITIEISAPKGLLDKEKPQNILPIYPPWIVRFSPMKGVIFDKFLRGAAWVRWKKHKKKRRAVRNPYAFN